MLKVTIKKDTMTPSLKRIIKAHESGGKVINIIGRAAANKLRAHFREKNVN